MDVLTMTSQFSKPDPAHQAKLHFSTHPACFFDLTDDGISQLNGGQDSGLQEKNENCIYTCTTD
jgi:hypothetical protein